MTSSYNPMGFGMERYGGANPGAIITRSAPKQMVQQGGKTVLKQGAKQGVGRFLGPTVNLGIGGIEAYQAAQEGRNPYRQLAKTATEMAAGGLAVAGGAAVGVPTTGPVGLAASAGLYTPASMGAGMAFDAFFPEQLANKDNTVYGKRTPGTFKVVDGKPQFVPGQDFVGPVPQPRTGKGGFVVVPKSEGGGIRFDPNFDQSSAYKQASTIVPPINPNQDLPASAEQSVDTTPFQHQMALYDQGRRAATTQAERNQVRDLGLAIHKEHNPHLYSDFQVPRKTDRLFNPTLSNQPTAVFPDGYPETLEAYIKEGGVQMPYTMTNKDARNEVIEANRLEGQQAAAAIAQELQAQEFMKAFMQQQAGKK